MRATFKKCLVLILLGGLLLALFHAWSPGTGSAVDIRPRQGGLLKKLIEEKTRDTIGGYHDIAYTIKEDVAG